METSTFYAIADIMDTPAIAFLVVQDINKLGNATNPASPGSFIQPLTHSYLPALPPGPQQSGCRSPHSDPRR